MEVTLIFTNNGYVLEMEDGEYICDMYGDNLFDTITEATAVFGEYALQQGTPLTLTRYK